MKRRNALLLPILMLVLAAAGAFRVTAQRRITPVKPPAGTNLNKERHDSIDVSKLVESVNEQGDKVYVDTITGKEVSDSLYDANAPLGTVPAMIQPLLFSTTVGLNFWDPLMRIFGQKYGLVEFSAEFNMHNRYIPVIEVGVGATDYTPGDQNYTYKVGTTPYFRIGCNYNFLYNSNPAYMAYAGIRFGYSPFNYQLKNVTVNNGYWDQTQTVDFPKLHSNVAYLNLLFGIRVKIGGPISMGWTFQYKKILHQTKNADGLPWYIPGYGTRNGSIGGSFSIFYTFQLSKPVSTDNLPKKKKKKPRDYDEEDDYY